MSMSYGVNFENWKDAALFVSCLPAVRPEATELVGEERVLLNDPRYPVIVSDHKLLDRSKAIRQELVSHPVNYSVYAVVLDSLFPEAGDFLVDMLCAAGCRFAGSVSLVSNGEWVLFRKTPTSLDVYNYPYFWKGKRIEALRAAFGDHVTIHQERL